MIRAQADTPGVFDEQEPFQSDDPLPSVDNAFFAVSNRHNAATSFHFGVGVKPFAPRNAVEVITQRPIACHGSGFAKQHLADINREIRMGIDVFGQSGCFGAKGTLVAGIAPVTVKLNMSQMSTTPLQGLHGFQSGGPVTGQAEIVAVDVHAMRQAQIHRHLGEVLDNLARGDGESRDRIVQIGGVAAGLLLPDFDAAGVHEFDGISFGSTEQPSGEVA
ncbi:hypothetical protein HRbin36_01320 [bacterium HR36]|nr:hypothetical protein HRbin36_01320 [bacterium HR36]